MTVRILHGDCLEVLPTLAAESVHAVITDPPYHLTNNIGTRSPYPGQYTPIGKPKQPKGGFMGQVWDGGDIAFRPEVWTQVLRVMKPGAHLLAFGGTRTSHRMVCAIEDAGFEIRDTLCWLYGSGFPKSHDISKGIDRAAGAERTVGSPLYACGEGANFKHSGNGSEQFHEAAAKVIYESLPATPEAAQWSGWGTALKPAYEPIILARKPLAGTVAANTLQHGCGGLNIDATRVETDKPIPVFSGDRHYDDRPHDPIQKIGEHNLGRWPANVAHDGSDEVEAAFAAFAAFGTRTSGAWDGERNTSKTKNTFGQFAIQEERGRIGDTGTASRFYFSGKATADDRMDSKHPTVKPLALMAWLVKLVTPPGGTVLDPFSGSGTTLLAADRLQFHAIGIEQNAEYVADSERRLHIDKGLFANI